MSRMPDIAPGAPEHVPVLVAEVIAALSPHDGGEYVDATFGAGGYSAALLDSCDCRVVGIDRDPNAIEAGRAMEKRYGGRLSLVRGRFGDMARLLDGRGVDGVAFDFGVSSMQLDNAERGFSFQKDGPLDMRMGSEGPNAADVVNDMDEDGLAQIIREYGEERQAKRIARAIVAQRPLGRTGALADVVRGVLGRGRDAIDPATRTFQAIRIHVNDELGEIDRGLGAAEALLRPGGRMAVVSFHSLEDRRVKAFMRARSGGEPRPSRHLPERPAQPRPPSLRLVKRSAIKPTQAEIAANPRSRSARLRVCERADAPAWPVG